MIADKREFIVWIHPRLNEIFMIQGSYIQTDNELLSSVHFLQTGQADFVYKKKFSYYKVEQGNHFGLEDIYFRMNQAMAQFIRDKEKTKKQRDEDGATVHTRHGYDSDDLSLSMDSEEEHLADENRAYEHVLSNPINAKNVVKAMSTCRLISLDKQHL